MQNTQRGDTDSENPLALDWRSAILLRTAMEHDLTLTREGEFKAYITGANHCGLKKNQKVRLKYHVQCICEPHLDARGFLVDQLTVHREFVNLGSTRLSCEKLAIEMCERLLEAIREENRKCTVRTIQVKVSPEPFAASMTYFREIPKKQPRKKTKKPKKAKSYDATY